MYSFKVAQEKDFRNMRDLWLKSFNDTKKSYNKFYTAKAKTMRQYIAYDEDNKPVASLYHMLTTINGKKAHYLYGANTAPDYRKKGIMRGLLEFSLDDAKAHGDSISVLFPADVSLYDFYKKFGYEENCFINKAVVSKNDLVHLAEYGGYSVSISPKDMIKLRNKLCAENCLQWNVNDLKFAMDYNRQFGGMTVSSANGYAILYSDKDKVVVTELICENDKMPVLLGEILRNTKKPDVEFHMPLNNTFFIKYKTRKQKYGMSRSLDGTRIDDIYIGLTCE